MSFTRALFLGPTTAKDSNAVETGAIITALDVYLAMGWKGKGSIIIETGSDVVFNWLLNNRMRPWMLHSNFIDTERRMARVGKVSFLKAEKSGNEMTYALAIEGIKRTEIFKAWW